MLYNFYFLADLGPFAQPVKYAGIILAASYALWMLVWRKSIWKTPQDIIPPNARNLLGIVLGIGIVILLLNADPGRINDLMRYAIILGIITVFSFVVYYFIIPYLTYDKEIAVSAKKTTTIKIIGGLWLRPEAKKIKKENGVTLQELLEGAASPDNLWSRFSMGLGKSFIIILYLLIISCGTLAITALGFLLQQKFAHS